MWAVILTTIFIVLKLSHVIDWSWWIIFLPVIIAAAILILLTSIVGAITLWLEN